MKRFLLLYIFIIALISACCPEPKELTSKEIEYEKQAIVKVNQAYNKASENKNFAQMVETLADEVIFFGTDSAEVIKTFADFKAAMLKQWERYDKMIYGIIADVYIQMDNSASTASIIYGVPLTVTEKNNSTSEYYFLRVARTMKKQRGSWVISSGIVGIVSQAKTNVPAVEPTSAPEEKKN